MSDWVSVKVKMPPCCSNIWAFRQSRPGSSRRVEVYYVGINPRECVEDDCITHWQPLVKPAKP